MHALLFVFGASGLCRTNDEPLMTERGEQLAKSVWHLALRGPDGGEPPLEGIDDRAIDAQLPYQPVLIEGHEPAQLARRWLSGEQARAQGIEQRRLLALQIDEDRGAGGIDGEGLQGRNDRGVLAGRLLLRSSRRRRKRRRRRRRRRRRHGLREPASEDEQLHGDGTACASITMGGVMATWLLPLGCILWHPLFIYLLFRHLDAAYMCALRVAAFPQLTGSQNRSTGTVLEFMGALNVEACELARRSTSRAIGASAAPWAARIKAPRSSPSSRTVRTTPRPTTAGSLLRRRASRLFFPFP